VIICFRCRLFLAAILLLFVTELAIGLNLESGLRTWININAEDDLYRNPVYTLILAGFQIEQQQLVNCPPTLMLLF
jgi:hypothetical protein